MRGLLAPFGLAALLVAAPLYFEFMNVMQSKGYCERITPGIPWAELARLLSREQPRLDWITFQTRDAGSRRQPCGWLGVSRQEQATVFRLTSSARSPGTPSSPAVVSGVGAPEVEEMARRCPEISVRMRSGFASIAFDVSLDDNGRVQKTKTERMSRFWRFFERED